MKKYWFNSIFFNNRLFCGHRNRISKAVDGVIPTIGNTSGGEYPVLNDTDKNIHNWNNHNQSCIDGYLCSEISSGGDSDSGKSINDNDIDNVVDNDSDEIFKEGIYYLNRTYLHTEDYTDYIDQYSDENLGSVDNDSNICNDEISNSSDSDSLSGSQDFKHLWVVCDQCYISNYKKDLKSNINICEYCGFHLKMNSSDRIEFSVDSGTWEPMDEDLVSVDPIDFDTEDTKGLEISEALKEFKELFEMLDEIAEKEGAEKKEAAEKLKEWEGWEGLKKKDKEEEVEEEEVEEWRKQWNDWEGWGKRQGRGVLEKLFDEPIEVLGDALTEKEELEKYKKRYKKKEWMDKAYEKLLKEFDEIAEEEGAEGRRKELDEWEGKELWALLRKVLMMNLEWWKWAEEAWDLLGLLDKRAELEEFQELFERLKKFKRLFYRLKGFKMVGDAIAEKKEPKRHERVEEGEGRGIQKEWMDKACEKLLKVFDEIAEEEEPDEACEKVLEMLNEIAEEEGAENDEEVEEVEEAKEEGAENDEEVEEVEEAKEEGTENDEEVEEVEEAEGEGAENDEEVEEVEEAEEEGAENDEEVEEVEEVEERSYLERLDSHQRETGLSEAVQTGIGRINGFAVAMGFMDFRFIGGSMGSVVGEKITRLIEYATKNSMPLIMVCASGGARMQEGTLSLMQMAKISSALKDFHLKRKSFYVSILTTPTTGGVTASFGMLGDIIIAEPNAHIAFAGPRIIEQLLNVTVPEGVQEAEYSFEKGLLDLIIPRNPLKGVLSELFQLHGFFSWSFR